METDFPVLATVWKIPDDDASSSGPGTLAAAGQTLRTDPGPSGASLALSLVPGTLAELHPAGAMVLGRLGIAKHAGKLLRRQAALTLQTGTLDVLITAPEGAAPSELRVATPAGEVLVTPGGLVRITVQPEPGNPGRCRVGVLCARGSASWDGQVVPAGNVLRRVLSAKAGVGSEVNLERIALNGEAQTQLATLLEAGARLQTLELQRQALPPRWRNRDANG